MRALVDLAAGEPLPTEADETLVLTDGAALADPEVRRRLIAVPGLRARVTVTTLERTPSVAAQVRGLAAARPVPVDVVLPIAEGLRPAAGRLVGLAHAAPGIDRFLLDPVPDPPLRARSPDDVRSEIAAAILAGREVGIPARLDDQTRVDAELLALRAGHKPVLRQSTTGDEAPFVARYRGLGLEVVARDGTFVDDEGRHARGLRLLYVAPTRAAAEAVAEVEARTFTPCTDVAVRGEDYRRLGLALGYPPCCVDAYVERVVLEPARDGAYVAEAFACARGASCAHPSWTLDHLLLETGDSVVPFAACRYDCPVAAGLAAAVFAEIEREAPLAARRMRQRLAVPLAVDRRGARAILELEGDLVRDARPRRTGTGAFVHATDQALAARLLGARVGDDSDVIVLRFDQT